MVAVVPQQLLHELRLQHGVGVEHAAHQHHQEATDREILEAKEPQVNKRTLVLPLPDEEADEAAHKEHRKEADKAGGEPVILFALVEHDLHAAHGDRQQRQANVIHVAQLRGVSFNPRRIFDEPAHENECQDADRNVDKENPAPGEVVRNPAAEGRSDRWRQHRDQAVKSKRLPAFLRFE